LLSTFILSCTRRTWKNEKNNVTSRYAETYTTINCKNVAPHRNDLSRRRPDGAQEVSGRLRAASERLRTVSGRYRAAPGGSGRLLVGSSATDNESPWAVVWRCLRDPSLAVSVEHRLVTDRQTERHDYGIYRARMASRGKIYCILSTICSEMNRKRMWLVISTVVSKLKVVISRKWCNIETLLPQTTKKKYDM